MESGRLAKWIFIALVLLFALFAMYPPMDVVVRRDIGYEAVAQTPEEAEEHGVEPGEEYFVVTETKMKRFLPLAVGDRAEEFQVIGRDEEGRLLKERETLVKGRVKMGLDIAGGGELVYRIKPQPGESAVGLVDKVIDTLKQRIDPHGVKEFRMQKQGANRILIQIPGATKAEVDQLKRRLTRLGKLEFRLAPPREPRFDELYNAAQEGKPTPGYKKMFVRDAREGRTNWWLVKTGDPAITGEYLARVYPTQDDDGLPAVGFQFDSMGARIFGTITEQNIGWHLAIILDGELKSAPVIRSRIRGSGIIEGNFTAEEVRETVNVLRAGSLPVDIELEMESTVGPSLGRDSIRMGLRAILVGGVLVLLFMMGYYLFCGLIADAALLFNLILLTGALGLLGASLTLPGLAGVMLTVGMAVDANVLVYERIREELSSGKKLPVAVRTGYERAFVTIVDANVTTLLTALILYMVGTGPVKGFAVTLSAGILLSMFTALFFTRLILQTAIARGWIKNLRMHQLVKNPKVNFAGRRRIAYVISLLVIATGITFFLARGQKLYDIDFTGGTLADISMEETAVSEVRQRLVEAGYENPEVQAISAAGTLGTSGRATEFAVRIKGLSLPQQQEKIIADLKAVLTEAGLYKDDGIRFDEEGDTMSLSLSRPVDETTLYELLFSGKGANYSTDTFRRVTAREGKPAKRFNILISEMDATRDPVVTMAQMLKALKAVGPQMWKVDVEKGEIEMRSTQVQTQTGMAAQTSYHLELKLNRQVDPELMRGWLYQTYEAEAIQVGRVGGEEDAGGRVTLEISGRETPLRELQEELATEISLPNVQIQGNSYTVVLEEERSESQVREALMKADAPPLLHLFPLDVESESYTVALGPLPEAKRQQKIRSDLLTIFEDKVRREPVEVTFKEVEDQSGVPEGRVRLTMGLGSAMRKDRIIEYLEMAGLDPALTIAEPLQDKESASDLDVLLPKENLAETQTRIEEVLSQPRPLRRIVSIGATVASELKGRAVLAIIFASIIIVLYVALRFHAFKFGMAAVIALIHDVLVTVGFVAIADALNIADVKINLSMLAAFLTIIGYSLNDTIVVFDRIRENMIDSKAKDVTPELINRSVNQTLGRTLLTSLTTLMVVLILFLIGGPVLQGLAFALLIGVLVGTYSSVFVASPVLLDWEWLTVATRKVLAVIFFPVTLPMKLKRGAARESK